MRYVTVVLLCLAACGGAPSPAPEPCHTIVTRRIEWGAGHGTTVHVVEETPCTQSPLYGADAGQDGASVELVVTCWDRTAATDSGLIQVPCEGP
jgi:hypothetical protein